MKIDAFGLPLIVGDLYVLLRQNGGLNATIVGRLVSENIRSVNLEPIHRIHFLDGEKITLPEDVRMAKILSAMPHHLMRIDESQLNKLAI